MSEFQECYVHGHGEFACADDRWAEYDARGIYLTTVCEHCRTAKLSKYRPEVLTDAWYDADEPIEPDW